MTAYIEDKCMAGPAKAGKQGQKTCDRHGICAYGMITEAEWLTQELAVAATFSDP